MNRTRLVQTALCVVAVTLALLLGSAVWSVAQQPQSQPNAAAPNRVINRDSSGAPLFCTDVPDGILSGTDFAESKIPEAIRSRLKLAGTYVIWVGGMENRDRNRLLEISENEEWQRAVLRLYASAKAASSDPSHAPNLLKNLRNSAFPIRDLISLLAVKFDLNVVIDDDVQGTVCVAMDMIPVLDGLDAILRSVHCTREVTKSANGGEIHHIRRADSPAGCASPADVFLAVCNAKRRNRYRDLFAVFPPSAADTAVLDQINRIVAKAELTEQLGDLHFDGDLATAPLIKNGAPAAQEIRFIRIDGRWFLDPAAPNWK